MELSTPSNLSSSPHSLSLSSSPRRDYVDDAVAAAAAASQSPSERVCAWMRSGGRCPHFERWPPGRALSLSLSPYLDGQEEARVISSDRERGLVKGRIEEAALLITATRLRIEEGRGGSNFLPIFWQPTHSTSLSFSRHSKGGRDLFSLLISLREGGRDLEDGGGGGGDLGIGAFRRGEARAPSLPGEPSAKRGFGLIA